jgi:L,D-transpeptidase YcbB
MLGALLFAVIFLTLGTYVASQDYEIVTQDGHMVTAGAVNDDVLEKLRTGKLAIRQKPGPTNALGLAKFMFQNEYPVHLHSTPSERLFARSRRGFWSWMYSNGDAR